MDPKESSPINTLAQLTYDLSNLEKNSKKLYDTIRKHANMPELAKAVHPEQTGVMSHIKRLKLIAQEIGKVDAKDSGSLLAPIRIPKQLKKGIERDLWLIAKSQQIIYQKLPLYKVAHAIATHLQLENSALILAQTLEDNEATSTWLQRILPRILNGETIVPIASNESKITI